LVATMFLRPPICAAGPTPVACAPNDTRVWVYDTLTDFAVALKLKCGDQVEIIGRVKGYVKIRTASGKQGYVPEAAFPNLPPYVDPNNNPTEGLAALIREREHAAEHSKPAPSAPANAPAPVAASAAISARATQPGEEVNPASVATAEPPAPPARPGSSSVSASANVLVTPNPVVASAAPAAQVKPVSIARKKTSTAAKKHMTPEAPKSPDISLSVASNEPPSSPERARVKSASVRPKPEKPADRDDVQVVVLSSSPAETAPHVEAAVQTNAVAEEVDVKQPSVAPAARADDDSSDSEDYPEFKPEDQSADPACRIFFSAYGLAPTQSRWMEEVRKKRYPGICPAPSPAKVDFVMIFTHDIDIYNSALPDPVHVDKNGFSDFDPLSPVDTALMSQADADKAHRQFVWVFRMRRGTFEPSKFSPRRRPQFTKTEGNSLTSSRASERALEDAFGFVQDQDISR